MDANNLFEIWLSEKSPEERLKIYEGDSEGHVGTSGLLNDLMGKIDTLTAKYNTLKKNSSRTLDMYYRLQNENEALKSRLEKFEMFAERYPNLVEQFFNENG